MGQQSSGNKGGAPKGNFNHLKHGFYSKRLRKIKVEEAEALSMDLNGELALLRALLRRFVELGEAKDDVDGLSRVVDVAGMTMVRIGTLLRTNYVLQGKGENEGVSGVIQRVLGEMLVEERGRGED